MARFAKYKQSLFVVLYEGARRQDMAISKKILRSQLKTDGNLKTKEKQLHYRNDVTYD